MSMIDAILGRGRAMMLILLFILPVIAACVATIFWGLNPTDFYAIEDKTDASDAVLSCIILFLLANIPSRQPH